MAALLKGERVLGLQTVQMILDALRSGALGRSDVWSSDAAKSVLAFTSTALQQVQPQSGGSGNTAELYTVLNQLPPKERARWDEILEELTSRELARALQRLAKIE